MKKNVYKLIYKVESEKLVEVIRVAWEVISEMGMEPVSIVLPDGTELPWNGYAAHQFAGEGSIGEKEFLEMSMKTE